MCCFCWTAFRRHKQKSGCVFVFPMIWQLFMPSCWAVASGCPMSYGRACYDRGKQKQLLFQGMLSSGRKLTMLQVLLLGMGVTILPLQQGGSMIRNRQGFFRFILRRVLPCLITLGLFSPSSRAAWKSCSETLVPEWLHPLPVIPLPCPHTLCHLHQCHLISCHHEWEPFISGDGRNRLWSLWLLSGFVSWNMVAESGKTWGRNAFPVFPPTLPDLV